MSTTSTSDTASTVQVDVIVPVHNAAATLRETLASALHQLHLYEYSGDAQDVTLLEQRRSEIQIFVCCYDDGSTDDSWTLMKKIAQEHEEKEAEKNHVDTTEGSKDKKLYIASSILIARAKDGVSRGAGFARNRAVDLRKQVDSSSTLHRFIAMLDSDDLMLPTRIASQVQHLMSLDPGTRQRTLVGCNFERDPPDSTWHYANWANTLTDERLVLEQFREVTLLQPTWMMDRSWFEKLGGYMEAPSLQQSGFNMNEFVTRIDSQDETLLHVVHATFETNETLRVAEDTRFFYKHLHAGGHLRLLRTANRLLIYKHRRGQSQSSQTSRKLLFHLRARAFESMVLIRQENKTRQLWSKFCVWGAGRDGKDFIKALQPKFRERIVCIVDVDPKKINAGQYYNKDLGVRIPIVHFSLLARDPETRKRLKESYEVGSDTNEAGFGRVQKSRDFVPNNGATTPHLPRKRQKVSCTNDFDESILPALPVVVCVAMYRTGGALEHNVKSIGRSEGIDLWHFS